MEILGVVSAVAVLASLLAFGTAAAQTGVYGDVPDDAYFSVPVQTLAADGVFVGTLCDEGFCPGDPINRKTMAVWTVRVLDGEDPAPVSRSRFNDVDTAGFYAPFIERLAELGVTGGCGDGSGFCPDRTVTRAEMAVFLSRAFDLPDGPDPGFGDVPDDAWYAAEVAKLAASGITGGCKDGTVFCPGSPTTRGQMATFLARATGALLPTEPAVTYKTLTAGLSHTCAIASDDTITCWGDNTYGEADAPEGAYKSVTAGSSHTCAIASDDTITCWGSNSFRQSDAPDGAYKTVTAGFAHTCAIASDDTITCWGDNTYGEADAPEGAYKSVTAGANHTCALAFDDTITCWGYNDYGRADALDGAYKSVTAGSSHTCAIASDDTITCWGDNFVGQSDAPDGAYKTVTAGRYHTCAVASDDTITCWGYSRLGGRDAPDGAYKTVTAGPSHTCAIASDDTITCWGPVPSPRGVQWTATPTR